jgi:CBS domain-containing protein
MTSELNPVAEFLRETLPFDSLPEESILWLSRAALVSYHRYKEPFEADDSLGLRIVRSGAVDLRDQEGALLDRLGEGESFNLNGLNAEDKAVTAQAIEDTLIYSIPSQVYMDLRREHRDLDRYFSMQRSRRLRRAARYEPVPHRMSASITTIMSRDVLTVSPSSSIREVATAMSHRRVSSAVVWADDGLQGIVTDRDLRVRCLAEGLSAQCPISDIMTSNPNCLDQSASVFDVTLMMTQSGIHHVPVVDSGKLVGMITTSDLMLSKQDDPVYLVTHIGRQNSIASIQAMLGDLPSLMVSWSRSGMRAQHVSRLLTAISDAVVIRLLQLAEREYGEAPVKYCWVGFGSQGRGEQLLGADQDNGMILERGVSGEEAKWFERVATFVCDGLAACGYRYCPGGIMATTDDWRVSLAQWQETVQKWTRTPTSDAVMRVTIFFDLRGIYGSTELADALQATMLAQAQANTIFIAALAGNALDASPPLGVFRRFIVEQDGEHKESLDMKKRGILPITDIARLHSLANGIAAVNTDERLLALARDGVLQIRDARNLTDALHTLQQVRIEHQCARVAEGEKVDNYIKPRALGTLGKEQLRDAFTIIKEAQTAVKLRYRAGLD